MAEQETSEADSRQYRGIWTCNNPDLPEREEHEMGTETAESLAELADKFEVSDSSTCQLCIDYNSHYEGSLDRVEVIDGAGEVVDTIQPEKLVDEHGMADGMHYVS